MLCELIHHTVNDQRDRSVAVGSAMAVFLRVLEGVTQPGFSDSRNAFSSPCFREFELPEPPSQLLPSKLKDLKCNGI